MASSRLVKRLQQGSDAWNRWRRQQPTGKVYDLIDANLRGIDLHHADLRGANLHNANLHGANLHSAKLLRTDLSHADLSSTDLSYANLGRAKLNNTDLNNADLRFAHLYNVDLETSDWHAAQIGWTVFGDIDLRTTIGLETVKHSGPSIIGLDTIYRSNGQIPKQFLQGTGVPKIFIANMGSLIGFMPPTGSSSCFISYSSRDEVFTRQLYTDLQRKGVRCWFAPEDLKTGDHYHQRIDESIHLYDKLILILSEHTIQSAWVEREVVSAREKEDHLGHEALFPIRLDDAVMHTTKAWAADVRRRWHIGDFTQWKDHDAYQMAFERFLHDLEAEQRSKS